MTSMMLLWQELRPAAKVSLVIGLVVIIGFMIGTTLWLSKEPYEVLFADLEARDAAAIVAELDKEKVEYKLAAAGSQIEVPQSAVHEIRLKLMGGGVPLSGGLGFEIFDKSDFGMTEFAQRINYQRALEGELMRTIGSLQEVKYARVHLVMPERGLFQQADQRPTASVTLFLHRNQQPNEAQITGVQRLVAAAVPGLAAEEVTVSDQNGTTLSRKPKAAEEDALASDRLELKRAVESYLTQKVSEVLQRSFGDSQVLVSIDATLNFDQIKTTTESVVSADGSAASGIQRRRETRSTPGGESGGTTSTVDVEYQLGRNIEQSVKSPGSIARLSVGVVVPPEMPEQERAAIRDLVSMAVGVDTARGDAIGVYAINGASLEGAVPASEQTTIAESDTALQSSGADSAAALQPGRDRSLDSTLVGLVGALVIVLVVVLWAASWRRRISQAAAGPESLSAPGRQLALERLQVWLQADQTDTRGEVQ